MSRTKTAKRTREAEPDQEFREWLASVSRLCVKRFDLQLDDLPDMLTRSSFDAGASPEEFFGDEVVPLVREQFGELSDEED